MSVPRRYQIILILAFCVAGLYFLMGFPEDSEPAPEVIRQSSKINSAAPVLPRTPAGPPSQRIDQSFQAGPGVEPVQPTAIILTSRPAWRGQVFERAKRVDALRPAVDGVEAEAWIEAGDSGKSLILDPNQNGEFPRITIQPGEIVRIAVAYQNQPAGLPVAIAVADAGTANGQRFGNSIKLDAAGILSFDFKADTQLGMYRLFLTTASGDRKMLHFWAGPETAPAAVN